LSHHGPRLVSGHRRNWCQESVVRLGQLTSCWHLAQITCQSRASWGVQKMGISGVHTANQACHRFWITLPTVLIPYPQISMPLNSLTSAQLKQNLQRMQTWSKLSPTVDTHMFTHQWWLSGSLMCTMSYPSAMWNQSACYRFYWNSFVLLPKDYNFLCSKGTNFKK
jgi:hypothetical protein